MRRYRKTIRLKDYDYSEAGGYFVTICTYKGVFQFGEISNQEVVLNDMGEMAEQCWLSLEDKFPAVELDYYAVMPNHVHGIIIVSRGKDDVGAIHELPLQRNKIERRRMLIPKIIGYLR